MIAAANPKPIEDKTLGTLPAWNLNDLYPGPQSKELQADLAWLKDEAKAFNGDYAGTFAKINGKTLGQAIKRYEKISELEGRIMSYAGLVYAGDMSDAKAGQFNQTLAEAITEISSELIFFTLELNKLSEERLQELKADPTVAHYWPWLRDLTAFRPHQLSDEVEKILHDKSVVGRAAWIRLFDETLAALRFPFKGEELALEGVLEKLQDKDGAARKEAALSIGKVLGDNTRTFALITNTLARDKAIDDKWRSFKQPVSSRNLANLVEDEVVEALVSAVRESFPRLSHRYYALKAKWLGADTMPYWDRMAPLPAARESKIGWDEAQETVLSAYRAFSPKLAEVGEVFFQKNWIDAPLRPGKAPGAFAHPTVPAAHPYLLLNYRGRPRDVMTLAHELGHGVHQVLSGGQGALMADTPLTLAETASVFGEMLTFQSILKAETDSGVRRRLLAEKVEDMLSTVVRQIAFHNFETRLHAARAKAELLPEEIGEIWMGIQGESLGPAITFDDSYRAYWCYIPHFIHTPFYVYAYAFGDCLVNALYAVYQDAETGFADKYLAMLSAGGTKRHKELLAPFGLNAADPAFWSKGLSVIEGMIDEIEALS